MKFIFALSLLASASKANAKSVEDCEAQWGCITFEETKLEGDGIECTALGDCVLEVCMHVDAACKGDENEAISHGCDGSDNLGCSYSSSGEPMFDVGEYQGCEAVVGRGSEDTNVIDAGNSKCEGILDTRFCQEGKPGDTLYWILKDGNGNSPETGVWTPSSDYVNDLGCTPDIECQSNLYSCGGTQQQLDVERVWSYTIPFDCLDCTSPAPTPAVTIPETGTFPPTPGKTPSPVTGAPTPGTPPPSDYPENDTLQPTPGTPSPVTGAPTPGTPPPTESPTGSKGDPHFNTWVGEAFDYHGQCDLVLVKDPDFADGLGLDIQIRTKLIRFWSYIKQASIRIGDDILEIMGTADGNDPAVYYWVNFEFQAELKTIGGFPVKLTAKHTSTKKRWFEIDLSSKYPGVKIILGSWMEFVRVDFVDHSEEAFGKTTGILGDYKTGATLARDGFSILNDFTELGQEWQVLPKDNMLFHDTAEPQFPQKCIEPEDPMGERRRRLDEQSVTYEQAEQACASLQSAQDRKDCVYDIIATQDLDMVGAY